MIKSTSQRSGCWQRLSTVTWLLAIWAVATVSAPVQPQPGSGGVPTPVTLEIPSPPRASEMTGAVSTNKKSRKGWVQVPLDALREMQNKYSSGRRDAPATVQGSVPPHSVVNSSRGIPETSQSDETSENGRRSWDNQRPVIVSSEALLERYQVPAHLAFMESNATWRGRYLDVVLHKGFTNQVFALLNGLAIAHLLNVTLALPEMTANYDYKVYSGMDIQRMHFDPAHKFRQRMDNFFDTSALMYLPLPLSCNAPAARFLE
eukprot:CAMPEP_0177792728 /NCGR_PEP_ID=MMETSP0491_2-20121128/24682_1 /TAXON_ID=63592 /ORGANISM="Tetraselmis chuii, Strain PLY429" /LENGTH=260 /DNA_ID=CAMNT_0019315167 /DNA_START=110 /DNA_END=889 /DNA_ORIENTATION=-